MPSSLKTLGGAALTVTALIAGLAGPAYAGDAPGNNGTLKVHSPGTPFEENQNEPRQACAFYLAGFNFDSNQVINYSFTVQGGANNGDAAGTGGSFTVGPDNGRPAGDGRTPLLEKEDHDLPDGRYKVTATTDDGSKSKVFSINCPGGSNPAPTPTPVPDGPAPEDPDVGGVDTPADEDEVPGEVGGVDVPADEDDGPGAVGGVDTGGGGLAGGGATFPLVMMGLGGAALAAATLRRRKS